MRIYRSKIVKKLIQENTSKNPQEIILRKANELHENYFSLFENNDEKFPIDMEMLASIAGIRVEKSIMLGDMSGQLVPNQDKFTARINEFDSNGRQNFTIGHEIGHTFFPDVKKRKFRTEKTGKLWGDNIQIKDEEEYLCDYAASELLIPTAYLLKQLDLHGFSVTSIPELANHFGASYEAIAIKMVSIAEFPCAILVSEKCLKPTEQNEVDKERKQLSLFKPRKFKKKLRVKYVTCSPSWEERFIPSFASIPENLSIYKSATLGKPIVEKNEKVEIKGFRGVFDLETFPTDFFDEEGNSKKTFTLIKRHYQTA